MEDLEKISHSESSKDSFSQKNFFVKFWQSVWTFIKRKIILLLNKIKAVVVFLYEKLEQISFWRAVFVGLALGLFLFGMMLFAAALWLVR